MPQLENAVEDAFGQILKSYPAFNEPNSPELLNIRFDLVSLARLCFKPWLCVDFAEHGYVELEVIGADTPWCATCRQFYHFAGDPACPKNKNRNTKGQDVRTQLEKDRVDPHMGDQKRTMGNVNRKRDLVTAGRRENLGDKEKGPEREKPPEGEDGKRRGDQGDKEIRSENGKGDKENRDSNTKGKEKGTLGRRRRVGVRKKIYRQVRKNTVKGKEDNDLKDTEMKEATGEGEKREKEQSEDDPKQEERNTGQGGGNGDKSEKGNERSKFAEEQGMGEFEGTEDTENSEDEDTESSEDLEDSEDSRSPKGAWEEDVEEEGGKGEEYEGEANEETRIGEDDSDEDDEEDFLGVVGKSLSGEGIKEGEDSEDKEESRPALPQVTDAA
ncbi:hypothetical protein CBR_g1131 [Chara braunii]|uniref:Uncharacterized protein n=1 Tax=Chara braunii TaxID=69332 RepID=A0A388KDA4_CHABU|nr:hypothetical protein CBR_g1131 [Chara braunii]|eukprot:GBG68011.1 hypothetical protein CBR_g1131 [Chara braunii]